MRVQVQYGVSQVSYNNTNKNVSTLVAASRAPNGARSIYKIRIEEFAGTSNIILSLHNETASRKFRLSRRASAGGS